MKLRPFRAGLVWRALFPGRCPGLSQSAPLGRGGYAIIMRPLARRPVSERGKTGQVHQRDRRWPQRGKTVGCANGIGVGRNTARRRGCANGAGVGRNATRRRGAPMGSALAATRPKEIAQGNAPTNGAATPAPTGRYVWGWLVFRPFRAGRYCGAFSRGVAPGYRMTPRWGAGVVAFRERESERVGRNRAFGRGQVQGR